MAEAVILGTGAREYFDELFLGVFLRRRKIVLRDFGGRFEGLLLLFRRSVPNGLRNQSGVANIQMPGLPAVKNFACS